MPSYRKTEVDGQIVFVPDDPPVGHVNPPLTEINADNRRYEQMRRDEAGDILEAVNDATRDALLDRSGKRIRKPIRPVDKF
jgi:hypothetical protein